MNITTSTNYFHSWPCSLDDCERHFCSEHRLLWRDHDTAISVRDGAGQVWWELSDCPMCVESERAKKRYALMMGEIHSILEDDLQEPCRSE